MLCHQKAPLPMATGIATVTTLITVPRKARPLQLTHSPHRNPAPRPCPEITLTPNRSPSTRRSHQRFPQRKAAMETEAPYQCLFPAGMLLAGIVRDTYGARNHP